MQSNAYFDTLDQLQHLESPSCPNVYSQITITDRLIIKYLNGLCTSPSCSTISLSDGEKKPEQDC